MAARGEWIAAMEHAFVHEFFTLPGVSILSYTYPTYSYTYMCVQITSFAILVVLRPSASTQFFQLEAEPWGPQASFLENTWFLDA